ncbi:glutathione S-transferase family protein [Leptospira ognonensis]|uniref:Glutathione S-transferase family protein n=1 Tax=Leptospira ognonensis TaxID=2484945 RepID=A0A4R9KB79_9LEPT|nr:glutathione S-transferase family protein [Leptospira ognonensis]TGL63964.1 glutathione S-transferase family protein [Leptospira ognonensis]
MKVYGDKLSGNCYKILLISSFLDKKIEWIDVDVLKGESRTSEFLKKNPNGKIPVLELDDGRTLSESNAIINYLSEDSDLMPTDKFEKYKTQQWQFFEQYSHEPFIAVARYINKYLGIPSDRKTEYESKQAGGHKALKVMEEQLARTPFLIGTSITVADISLYAYTHVAPEGGFDLESYPFVLRWIKLIEKTPGYIKMS